MNNDQIIYFKIKNKKEDSILAFENYKIINVNKKKYNF